jgi:hypothetical protein
MIKFALKVIHRIFMLAMDNLMLWIIYVLMFKLNMMSDSWCLLYIPLVIVVNLVYDDFIRNRDKLEHFMDEFDE